MLKSQVFRALLLPCCCLVPVRLYAEIDYIEDVQPILAQHCFECHGPDQQEAGFRFDQRDSVVRAADSGAHPIVPGRPAESALIQRVRHQDIDVRMPPEDHEPLTSRQIDLLEAWVASGAPYSRHWAYAALVRPRLPEVENESWCANPIDYFVAAKLDGAGVMPSPEADRNTVIKRLYYDLLGLTPPIAEADAFARDSRPDAYQHLVDRLLASPRFGERWGRHWLDKARYADSDGYEKDNPRPHAWHYRDWVITAINDDMAFDEFTVQQLAGDLLPETTDQQRLATAFHRQTLTNTEGGTDQEQWRVAAVMDRTETLGTVWLGLTVGCAGCHNHKYDSISQDEYYQLYAFFNNGDETAVDLETIDGDAKIRVIQQRTEQPRTTHVLERGDFLRPQHAVEPGTLAVLPPLPEQAQRPDRLELAKWLVRGENPLPARVAVNHIWLHLFGEGLVRTVNDFGTRGERPTHPELLEWLATELIQQHWSRKQLIRTVLLSSTYRQSSRHRPQLAETDPSNRLLHRQNRFRVEAETMRDIALSASGLLTSRIGGPSVFPPIPPSVTDLTYNSGFRWEPSQGADRYRRGMYTFFKRTAPHPNLTTFDCPSSNVTNVRREVSNTPIGALVTLNNTVFVDAAQALAHRGLARGPQSDRERVTYLMRLCVSRRPDNEEVKTLVDLLHEARNWYQQRPGEARKLMGGVPLQADASDLAAWVAVSRIVLNLDEFITRE